ncbi:hypothetical protein ACQKCU_23780 [Heyndrickxia sporothermodurans]
MEYLKINNFPRDRAADYKGLNLNQIVPGTQLYPAADYAIVGYEGEVPEHEDLEIVSEEYYQEVLKEINENAPKSPLDILKEENQQLQQDIGSLLFESANDKAEIAMLKESMGNLLLEVAELKLGGNA